MPAKAKTLEKVAKKLGFQKVRQIFSDIANILDKRKSD